MMRFVLDDQISELNQSEGENLGDFLSTVTAKLPPNRVITEILLDGVQVPKHRQKEALCRTLQKVQELQIRTADATHVAAHGLDTAISNVERLRQSLLRAAELFRESPKPEANRYFYRCIEGLERFLEIILITRNVMRLDFKKLSVDGLSLARVEQEFQSILTRIVALQEQGDFDSLADEIEYPLLTNLHLWHKALNQLRLSSVSNA